MPRNEEVRQVANRIKGITVEIGGDTTKLQNALKGVNSSIKTTQAELKDVEKLPQNRQTRPWQREKSLKVNNRFNWLIR